MALSSTPKNPYSSGEQAQNIRAEKIKVLTAVAELGTEGYEIYDQARQAIQEAKGDTPKAISSHAPVALIQSISDRHTEHLDVAMAAIKSLREAEGAYYGTASSSIGTYMDQAAADRSGATQYGQNLDMFESRGRELQLNTRPYALRARPPVRSGGGGGGGRRGGSGSGFSGALTVPQGTLEDYTGVTLGGDIGRLASSSIRNIQAMAGSGSSRPSTSVAGFQLRGVRPKAKQPQLSPGVRSFMSRFR